MKTIDRISIPVSSVGYFLVYVSYFIFVINPFNLDVYVPVAERTLPSDVPFAYLRGGFIWIMVILSVLSSAISIIRFNSSFAEYFFNLIRNCCSIAISFIVVVVLLCIWSFSVGLFKDGIPFAIRYFYDWVFIFIVLLSIMVSIFGLAITGFCKIVDKISKKQRR